MKNALIYLQDLLHYLRLVEQFTNEGREAFLKDVRTQLAVIRAYEVIGEIVKRLPAEIRDQETKIEWRKLAGFRDFLAHNYEEIVLDYIWRAVEDLPDLKSVIEELIGTLQKNQPPGQPPEE
ncbi:MAG: DUF86 domain-containing protein [Chloroflexi bacterium]|nr:DUF86 domain-containing protein [Chloroflexota bacterium]